VNITREILNQRIAKRTKRDGCCGVISPVISSSFPKENREKKKIHAHGT